MKLQLSIKDIAKYKLRSIEFTAAKFNNFNEDNLEHTSISSSTGNYIITWNLQRVLKGALNSY